ncbi:LOW QUALITY PROTEIN: cholinesterase [Callorhinchus milii]|uniref:LOW QUALITY PROTEIN: cholinesterase n=1 Tax=Callorhinchus milii TaxID=7868 RepID=UPI001C3FB777|nr:LOW QUALITY PROTEIN: cholinesterase [Callorhinchus milii]
MVVQTSAGRIRGKTMRVLSGKVTAYLGIPYAEPPIGQLRFAKPVPSKPWTNVREVTKYSNTCYQNVSNSESKALWEKIWSPNTELSENCLYLNLWVPSPRPKKAAVMVWIHGGAFMSGSSSLLVYNGRFLSHTQKVIVVSMNYRLGVFGFLALPGNSDVPGNMGLFDQRLALQWVHDNIAAFGGNPKSVTLFGQSAGAASINMHLIASQSSSLFHRVIMQSGSSNTPWAFVKSVDAKHRAAAFGKRIGCPYSSDAEFLSCLRGKSAYDVLCYSLADPQSNLLSQVIFLPVATGDFFTEKAEMLMQQKIVEKKQILQGTNRDEATYFLAMGGPGFSKDTESVIGRKDFVKAVKWILPENTVLTVDDIECEYIDEKDEDSTINYRDAVASMAADSLFVCPMKQFANKYAGQGNKVYSYLFNHLPPAGAWQKWMGVMHGYEIVFVFGMPFNKFGKWTQAEEVLSKNMMNYWSTFARTGNPIGQEVTTVKWPVYTQLKQQYIILNAKRLEVKKSFESKRVTSGIKRFPNSSRAEINETEEQWKEEFSQWYSHILGWKDQFNAFKNKKYGCAGEAMNPVGKIVQCIHKNDMTPA